MAEFESEVELSIVVPQSEVSSARATIEDGLSDIELGISNQGGASQAMSDGGAGVFGSRRGRRVFRYQRQQTELAQESVTLLESIDENLDDGSLLGGGGGGDDGGFNMPFSLPTPGGGGRTPTPTPNPRGSGGSIPRAAGGAASILLTLDALGIDKDIDEFLGTDMPLDNGRFSTGGAVQDGEQADLFPFALFGGAGSDGSPFTGGQQSPGATPVSGDAPLADRIDLGSVEPVQSDDGDGGGETNITVKTGDTTVEVDSKEIDDILKKTREEREKDLKEIRKELENRIANASGTAGGAGGVITQGANFNR